MIDQLLQKAGLKYEDLNIAEKETLNSWLEAYQSNDLSVEKIRDFIESMKRSVEEEISKCPTFVRVLLLFKFENPQLILFQARLRNLLLLEAMLLGPERAKKQMEQAIYGMAKRS